MMWSSHIRKRQPTEAAENRYLPDIGQMSNGSLSMVKTSLPADAMLKHGGDEYEYGNCRTVYFRMS